MSVPVVLLALATFATFVGFQLLLSVVPLYAGSDGGSSGAGLATAAFMLSTVLTQIRMPRLMERFGYRTVLMAGMVFLGIPAFFYPVAREVAPILVVTLLRGVGFGIVTVVFAALVVELAPPGRRGEALGVFGVAIALPTVFCNALGLWLVENTGYGLAFLAGGAAPLLGLAFVLFLPVDASPRRDGDGGGPSFLEGLGRGPLLRLFLLFATSTSAAGVLVTFLPLAVPGAGLYSSASALLIFGLASTASRWWAGRFGDLRDPHHLLTPGLLASALGMALLPQGGPVLLGGALLFGAGFGLLQSSTLILTMERVGEDERGLGSALWNVSFDAGTGVGALLFGFLIGEGGFSVAFYLSSALLAASLVLVALDRLPHDGADRNKS